MVGQYCDDDCGSCDDYMDYTDVTDGEYTCDDDYYYGDGESEPMPGCFYDSCDGELEVFGVERAWCGRRLGEGWCGRPAPPPHTAYVALACVVAREPASEAATGGVCASYSYARGDRPSLPSPSPPAQR